MSNELSGAMPLIARREAAELSGTTLGTVNKAIEQKVLRTKLRKGRMLLTPDDVGALALLAQTRVVLPVAVKRRIAAWARGGPEVNAELALDGALIVRMSPEVAQAVQHARRYVELRERLVEVNPKVRGGTPVITETRMPVRSLARLIELGETREVMREDYPFLPEESFELAPLWTKTHPRQGRPSRPWATGERTSVSQLHPHARAA